MGAYLWDGYRRGFLTVTMELGVFVVSIVAAFFLNSFVGNLFVGWVDLPESFAEAFGFMMVWFVVQLLLSIGKSYINFTYPEKLDKHIWARIGGVGVSFVRGASFIILVLLFGSVLSSIPSVKSTMKDSAVANGIASKSEFCNAVVRRAFGESVDDMITFLTVNPLKKSGAEKNKIIKGSELIELGYKTTKVSVDSASEKKMLELVNKERRVLGLSELVSDERLQNLARQHAKDMFARGYFSHVTPDDVDPFERMTEAAIDYETAGENLALAPTVELAHEGLMNSEGHRANILEQKFGHVGIGVIDAGPYGKMFVQEFTD